MKIPQHNIEEVLSTANPEKIDLENIFLIIYSNLSLPCYTFTHQSNSMINFYKKDDYDAFFPDRKTPDFLNPDLLDFDLINRKSFSSESEKETMTAQLLSMDFDLNLATTASELFPDDLNKAIQYCLDLNETDSTIRIPKLKNSNLKEPIPLLPQASSLHSRPDSGLFVCPPTPDFVDEK
jgi:hypothetical protein